MLKNKDKYLRYEFNQSPFYCLQSKKKLRKLLRLGKEKLKEFTKSEGLYREKKEIIEGKPEPRLIEKPKPDLKKTQKRIEDILKRIKIPTYIQAPAINRSYITNAKIHTNAKQVRNLDIKQYFFSTCSRRVYWFFNKQMRCSKDVSAIVTRLLTYKGHLPTGSPSSPIISYFSHMDMWKNINELAENANCRFTVYMDDITISGDSVSDQLIWQIKQQLHLNGLHNNQRKEKNYVNKPTYEITGIIVTKEGKLKLPNRQHLKMHKIRQALPSEYDVDKKNKQLRSLKGMESQLQQINKINNNNSN